MKRLFLLGTCALVLSATLFSCTADEYDTTTDTVKPAVSADDPPIDGQSGQTPIPPPKP